MNSRQRFLETMAFGSPDHAPLFKEGMRSSVFNIWEKQGLRREQDLATIFNYDLREEIEPDHYPIPDIRHWPETIKQLEELGWISIERRKTGNGKQNLSNIYLLLGTPGDGARDTPGIVRSARHDSAECAPEVEPLNESHKKDTTLTATPSTHTVKAKKNGQDEQPIKALLRKCEEVWGYPTPNGGQEAKAAKWLQLHYSDEDIVGCIGFLSTDGWWDSKHISLQTIKKRVGPWVKAGRPETSNEERMGMVRM